MKKIFLAVLLLSFSVLFLQSQAHALTPQPSLLARNYASDSADMVTTDLAEEEPKFSLSALNAFTYCLDQLKIVSVLRLIGIIQSDGINNNSYLISSFDKNNEWIDTLVKDGELSSTYAKISSVFNGKAKNCAKNNQSGICYSSDGKRAVLLAKLNYSPTNKKCTKGSAFYMWDSKDGSKQVCLTSK